MSDWNGQGLPPAAQARMERARDGAPASSLLSIAGQTGLEGCGFRVVGEVMGCIVEHIGWDGWGGCGYYGQGGYGGGYGGSLGLGNQFGIGGPVNTVTSSGGAGYTGFGAYAQALYAGYDTAMLRMLTECQAVGGDGVVGVSLTVNRLGNDNREFLAYGTAVKANGPTRPRALFSTILPGQDVAKLLHGGWAPAGIVVGLSIAIRHDDWATVQQASTFAGNTEVSGYSDLVNHVRSDARREFERRTAAYGADGAISSSISLDIWEREAGENHRDHVALASVIGTAIARFHKGAYAPTNSLKILPLESPRRSR
ncbi:MAG: heavy metal-binding domain-containing protein [Acidimicrobiales bacterium]